jgi:VanZ family protein
MPRPRSHGIVIALLLGTLALIFYGSLYPFDLTARVHTHSIGRAILELSWARAGRGDRVANVLLYAPLGFCLLLWLDGRLRRSAAVATVIGVGVALSFCIEVTQVYIALRVPSWWDVVLNGVGTIIGATAGVAWHELGGRMRTANAGSGRADRSGLLVVALWLAWRLMPFVPHLDLSKLKSAFSPLADPDFSTQATIHYWVWWTLLAHIVFALTSAQRGIETLLALIAVVLVGCLTVAGHVFVPSELLALLLLLPTLFVFDRLTPRPRRWILLGILAGLMIYDSFDPFLFRNEAGSVDLWPFMGWIDSGFPVDWQWLARRACYFAALFWVLKEAGMSLRVTTIFVPLAVLCIEVLQLWVPGQRASITEPAFALAIAWTMRILDAPPVTRPRVRNH